MSGFDHDGLDFDGLDFPSVDADEAEDAHIAVTAERSAKPFAKFYNKLRAENVDQTTARELTALYATKIWDLNE
jgi:hypothetical protein